MQIWNDIKQSYQRGSIVTRLIYINVAIFIVLRLVATFASITITNFNSSDLLQWLAVPASLSTLIFRFWTVISYQFVHYDFLHLVFNMLWLYWFGAFFLQFFSQRQILSVYFLGGILGAAFYLLSFNLLPYYQSQMIGGQMIGASASILALVTASATAAPNRDIHLMLIGRVKLKYLAIGTIIIDLMSITSSNAGGHIAHLGGAFAGYLFASTYLKQNRDISIWISKSIDQLITWFKPRKRQPKMKARHTANKQSDWEYNKNKKQKSKELDRILEKIKTSGYDSLSKQEKEALFKASK